MRDRKKVFLNAFFSENLGDDLFVQIITHRYPDVDFYLLANESYGVRFGSNVHFMLSDSDLKKLKIESKILNCLSKLHVPTKIVIPKFVRFLNRKKYALLNVCDISVYVIGSGFMESGNYNVFDYIADYKYYNKNLYLLSCNFGPYYSERYLKRHEKLFSMAMDVCFRDSFSYNYFRNLKNTRYAMDLVFNYNLGINSILPDGFDHYVVISVVSLRKDTTEIDMLQEKSYIDFLCENIRYIMEKGLKIVLVGFCKAQGDDNVIERIIKQFDGNKKLMYYNYPDITHREMVGVFAGASFVITSRYHAAILGMLYRKKIFIISYSEKIVHVLQDIDDKIKWVNISELDHIRVEDFLTCYGYRIDDERLKKIKEKAEEQFVKLDEVLF